MTQEGTVGECVNVVSSQSLSVCLTAPLDFVFTCLMISELIKHIKQISKGICKRDSKNYIATTWEESTFQRNASNGSSCHLFKLRLLHNINIMYNKKRCCFSKCTYLLNKSPFSFTSHTHLQPDTQSYKKLTDDSRRVKPDTHFSFQQEPNSSIHFSYFSRSAAETDLDTFFRADSKSSMVVGMCISSRDMLRISSGVRPSILRLMAIREASLQRHTALYFKHFEAKDLHIIAFFLKSINPSFYHVLLTYQLRYYEFTSTGGPI